MPIFKRLKFFQKYESLKKIHNIIELNKKTIQKNLFESKTFVPFNKRLRNDQMSLVKKGFPCYREAKILSERFTWQVPYPNIQNFFSYLKIFIKKYNNNYFLFLKKRHKKTWIKKIQILLQILFKKLLCHVDLLSFVKKIFKNFLKIRRLNFTFFFTNNIKMFLLYYFIHFGKFHYFQYKMKIFKRKKEQRFFNFYKSFLYIEVKNFISFLKFYKKNFVFFFKIKKLLWNNFFFKKEIKGFVFKNSFFNKERNWLNFIKFRSLIQFCLKLFYITNYNSYLIYKGGYREKNFHSLKFKENLLFLKKKTYLNFDKFLLVRSFFLLKNKKTFLFNTNFNHLNFFSTFLKISNFFYIFSNLTNFKIFKSLNVISNDKATKTSIKKEYFFYFNFLTFKQKNILNKILRNKNQKLCFYNLFSKSFFLINISSKNLLTEFNKLLNNQSQKVLQATTKGSCFALNQGDCFSQVDFVPKNLAAPLNINFFGIWFCQSNFKKIFYDYCFYFIYKINKIKQFNLQKFVQKKWYKSKNLNTFEINLKLILVESLKNFIFIQQNSNDFFKFLAKPNFLFRDRLEKLVLFLLKSYIDFIKFKFSAIIYYNYYKKPCNKKRTFSQNQLKTNFDFKGFSIFFISPNFIFEKNKRFFKNKVFSLKTFHKFSFYIKKEFILLPSKKEIIKHLKKLEKIVYNNFSQTQNEFLLKLKNPIINWCFNYRIINRPEIFIYCDNVLKNFLWKWVCHLHINKRKQWIKKKYFALLKTKIFPILTNKILFTRSKVTGLLAR